MIGNTEQRSLMLEYQVHTEVEKTLGGRFIQASTSGQVNSWNLTYFIQGRGPILFLNMPEREFSEFLINLIYLVKFFLVPDCTHYCYSSSTFL